LRDRYTIENELGHGGMAIVYLATDLKHQRSVAIKVLRPELSATLATQRFQREIRISGRLQHPHILGMFDSGVVDGQLYYVMPYVEGETLRERLRRELQLPVSEAIDITCEIAEALGYAHAKGVVHRDVKPENILLSSQHALIADFGVARAVAVATEHETISQGLAIGTPAYMSPEQATADDRVDGRSDIYGLACVLYEMLVGEPPFTGPNSRTVLARHAVEPVKKIVTVRPAVPLALEAVVLKALEKNPVDRFEKAEQFADSLRKAIQSGVGFQSEQSAHIETPVPHTPKAAYKHSVAVLPFKNVGANSEKEYFSDGITEELISALGRVPGLQVASRSSAFFYKGKDFSLPEIGQALGVDTVLEGSVRWSGEELRVTAELNDVAHGCSVWSGSFGRKLRDVFSIQEEITSAIVTELRLTVGDPGTAAMPATSTRSPEAYQLYLRGRYCWNQRTPEGFQRALHFFAESIKSDPNYAFAHSGMADVYIALSQFQFAPPQAVMQKAEDAAHKAISLQESVAEAHLSLAHIHEVFHWNWREAEKEYLRALELDPKHARAHAWYADYLMAMVRTEESFRWMERAKNLEPLSVPLDFIGATLLYRSRRFDEAFASYKRIIQTEPSYYGAYVFLGFASTNEAHAREAVEILRRAIGAMGPLTGFQASLGCCLTRAGQRDEALEIAQKLLAKTTTEYVAPAYFVILYATLGDKDAAFEWLEKAYADKSLMVSLLQVEPSLDPLRDDPRFKEFLTRVFPT
jgi:serine/threonine-protein kinase